MDFRAAHGLAAEEEAQYSTAYAAAAAMVRGEVSPAEVAPGAFADSAIRRLAEGMEVRENADFSAAVPARRLARVILRLADGRCLASTPTEARFDPEAPAGPAEVRAKFHAYATPPLGSFRAAAIACAVDTLGPGVDVADLADLLTAPVAAAAAEAA